MEQSEEILKLHMKVEELQQKEIACANYIQQLTSENLELIKSAAQAKALKKQLDILLSDQSLIKMKAMAPEDIDVESDSIVQKQINELIEKIREISADRDKYAQDAAEKSHFEEEIKKKNSQILELRQDLTAMTHMAEMYKLQVREQNQSANEEIASDSFQLKSLEETNERLNSLLNDKAKEIGSLSAKNADLSMRAEALSKQLNEAQMMITLQQTENKIITEPSLDKESFAIRIQKACEHIFENAENQLSKLQKRVEHLGKQVQKLKNGEIKQNKTSNDNETTQKMNEMQEIIMELEERIDDYEANDYAPKYAPALKRIEELEAEIRFLKDRK